MQNNKKFMNEVDAHNKEHEGLRKKEKVAVALTGFPELLGKLHQIQF